jgi:hypothetical protein
MAWNGDQLDRIAESEEIQITTTRRDGTQRRWIPIWVVRVGGDLYIRAARGRAADWYRHATAHHRARIRADGVETDVTLVLSAGQPLKQQVDAAYRAKYESQSWLAQFLEAPANESTLRLDKAQS